VNREIIMIMAAATVPLDPAKTTGQFYAVLKGVSEFDKLEVNGVIRTLLTPSDREKCFIATYLRGSANVATLLELKWPKDFQAINMLARTLFELAVDARLINVIPKAPEKMIAFVDVEKLKCARKILKFHASHAVPKVDTSIYSSFVASEATRIGGLRSSLWPGLEKLSHWSGMNLPDRTKLLKAFPFEKLYEINYPHLSWQVHSGLTGVINLKAATFTTMCGCAFILAADSYREILLAMIEEFKIERADDKIKKKLKTAKMLPFAESREQAEQLLREAGG
jgi:hypothetical protein